jgi:alkylation response protein AidB-like acyl-CoA dehydrogenase
MGPIRQDDLDTFRLEVRAELKQLLADYERPVATVMGAGSEDIEPARRFLELLAPGGWAVPSWPAEFGGRGVSGEEARIVRAELEALHPPDLYPFQVGLALVGPTVLRHGTPEQQARWLPDIGSGTRIWCQLFSEPGAGSDLAGLSCRAERTGTGWRVTGSKVWSSRAQYADLGVLLARFDPTLPKHEGIVALAIDMAAPGVDVRPLRQMNGDSHFNEVFLDGVEVPDTERIGEAGGGWSVARTVLGFERKLFGAEGSGTGAGVRRALLELARTGGAGQDPVLRDRLVQVWCDLEIARLTARRAGALAAAGRPAAAAAAGAKLRTGRNLRAVADLALAIQGPAGALAGGRWADLFLTAPSMSIRGGTDEIQRNTIGEMVLGLPKEPRADQGPFDRIGRSS